VFSNNTIEEKQMRINGEDLEGVNEDILVLPRGKGDIVFKGKALHDFDEFDRLMPMPKAPRILKKNVSVEDASDPGFKQQRAAYEVLRFAYMVIKTLEPSNIEWDNVKLEDPSTWNSWADELANHLSVFEQRQVIDFIHKVNTLDQAKIDAARNAFLAGLAQAKA
jgi:hypothetical protein